MKDQKVKLVQLETLRHAGEVLECLGMFLNGHTSSFFKLMAQGFFFKEEMFMILRTGE